MNRIHIWIFTILCASLFILGCPAPPPAIPEVEPSSANIGNLELKTGVSLSYLVEKLGEPDVEGKCSIPLPGGEYAEGIAYGWLYSDRNPELDITRAFSLDSCLMGGQVVGIDKVWGVKNGSTYYSGTNSKVDVGLAMKMSAAGKADLRAAPLSEDEVEL